MKTLVYPGTFDPFTNGHLDIARRAARLCDRLIVLVLTNYQKHPVLTLSDRVALVEKCMVEEPRILVQSHAGLLVDYMRDVGAVGCVRGLRSESDFRFEAEIAAANRILYPDFESILLPCRPDLAFTSSSIVREVAAYGGDISGMVPAAIYADIVKHMACHVIPRTTDEKIDDIQPEQNDSGQREDKQ